MKKPDNDIQLTILRYVIEKQNLNGRPKNLPVLCSNLQDKHKYNKEDIIAAIQFLINEEYITAADQRGIEQGSVPPRYCDGGTFRLSVTKEGRDYFYERSKSIIDKLREMTRAEKIIYAAGGYILLRSFEIILQWAHSLLDKPHITP